MEAEPITVDSEELEVNIDGEDEDDAKFQDYIKQQLLVHKKQVESQTSTISKKPSVSTGTHFALREDVNIADIVKILDKEFSEEIRRKEAELLTIDERIKEGEALLTKLETSCWSYNTNYKPSTKSHTKGTAKEEETEKKKEDKKAQAKMNPFAGDLFARTPDGTFMKVSCPACKRDKFVNKLGFVNHCRIVHMIKFNTYEEAVLQCGTPVDPSLVPADDPCRKREGHINIKLEPSAVREHVPTEPIVEAPKENLVEPEEDEDYFATEVNVTRFHVKKRIIVGNTSKHLKRECSENPDQRASDKATHKWMVYVRGITDDDISKFVKKVRFHLDSSYKPNDVLEVSEHPFQITRRGWAPFVIRVQLFFKDQRNKPVSVFHQIKLDQNNTGKETLGGETQVDVMLDRQFFDDNNIPYEQIPKPAIATLPSLSSQSPEVQQLVEQKLQEVAKQTPIPRIPVVPQLPELMYAKKRALQWRRSKRICGQVAALTKIKLTTKEVSVWCRFHGC